MPPNLDTNNGGAFLYVKANKRSKIEIYEKRKLGKSIQELSKVYHIRKDNIKYLIRLIDRHGSHVIKTTLNIIQSDQGWQYQMEGYHKFLSKKGSIQSMSRKVNCLDNSPIENFFGKMKCFTEMNIHINH